MKLGIRRVEGYFKELFDKATKETLTAVDVRQTKTPYTDLAQAAYELGRKDEANRPRWSDGTYIVNGEEVAWVGLRPWASNSHVILARIFRCKQLGGIRVSATFSGPQEARKWVEEFAAPPNMCVCGASGWHILKKGCRA